MSSLRDIHFSGENYEALGDFFILPEETLLVIFSYLTYKSLTAISLTCKSFHRLANDPSLDGIWPVCSSVIIIIFDQPFLEERQT
jgi:hypothetical protein